MAAASTAVEPEVAAVAAVMAAADIRLYRPGLRLRGQVSTRQIRESSAALRLASLEPLAMKLPPTPHPRPPPFGLGVIANLRRLSRRWAPQGGDQDIVCRLS